MKVLVTGAAGLLGRDVWEKFSSVHSMTAIGRTQPAWVPTNEWTECDLSDSTHTYKAVTRTNPDLVVHCAAYNNVDGAENEWRRAYLGNSLAVRNLALACQRFDTALMAISTDYVFDGTLHRAEGYRETDAPNPISRYGESKLWGERFAQQLLSKAYVVRTSWLFGPGRPTWVDAVAASARNGKPVFAARDMVSAPTYTPDLAQALLQLAESHRYGTYHLTNQGFCSRVEFAEEVLKLVNKEGYFGLKEVVQAELKLPARRPAFSGLQNLAWELDGFQLLRPWKQALKEHFSKAKVLS